MTTTQPKESLRPRRRRKAPPASTMPAAGAFESAKSTAAAVEGLAPWPVGPAVADVQVVVRVTESDYVPDCVQIRARISAVMFTAQLPVAHLEQLQQDPRVESVGFPRSVHPTSG